VLLLWTLPAYLVCEIVSTTWQLRMHSEMASRAELARARETESSAEVASRAQGVTPGDNTPGEGGRGQSGGAAASDSALSLVYGRLIYIAFLMQVQN